MLKAFKNISKFIKYFLNPRYMIMQGIRIDNRAIMFLGARPLPPKDTQREIQIHGYVDNNIQETKISFENQPNTYYKSNKHKTIWTFKELLFWRRMLPNNTFKCLEFKDGKWQTIKSTQQKG